MPKTGMKATCIFLISYYKSQYHTVKPDKFCASKIQWWDRGRINISITKGRNPRGMMGMMGKKGMMGPKGVQYPAR